MGVSTHADGSITPFVENSDLRLGFLPVTDRCAASLTRLTNLQILDLSETRIKDEGFRTILREHPRPVHLHIPPWGTAVGLADLASLKKLHTLKSNGHISAPENVPLLQRLKFVRTWQFVGVSDLELKTISTFKQVESLILNWNKISPKGMADLAQLPSLRGLNLDASPDIGDEHIFGCAPLKQLTLLSLGNTGVTDDCIKHLQGMINLERLHLQKTKVTADGVAKLQTSLPNCTIYRDGK